MPPGYAAPSHQPPFGEACVSGAREDEVVVDWDPHDLAGFDKLLRHRNVIPARLRVAQRVVVRRKVRVDPA